MCQPSDVDATIEALADEQHEMVARWQLIAAGLTKHAIDHRIARGRLRRQGRGVYKTGGRRVSQRGRWMAAVLAGGAGGLLGGRSAASLWSLRRADPSPVEVTLDHRRRSGRDVRFRRSAIPEDERTTRDGIPVTTVARTLLDLAGLVDVHELERALHEAEVQRLAEAVPLGVLLDRHPRSAGAGSLRRLVAALDDGPTITDGALAEAFRAFVVERGLPRPETEVVLHGFRVDCVWREERLVVELDGRRYHDTSRAFEDDRLRDRVLTAAGWRVVRVTWRQLEETPDDVARDLTALLAPTPAAAPAAPP